MPDTKSSEKKEELSIDQKRLDTLAKILECSSMCVAVVQINGQFLISANEFNKRTGTPEKFKLIVDIMEYFKRIASSSITSSETITKERDLLMQRICSARLGVLGQGKLNTPVEAIREFITTQRLEIESYPKTAECTKYQKQTKKSNIPAAFFDMLIIYRKFLKIEHSIKHALNGHFDEITLAHLNAFQTFSQVCVLREVTDKAHAEMQILGKLINEEIKGRVHIGISKLCCTQCRCVLDVAKETFEQLGYPINLSYKGTHERSFGTNWCFPSSFYGEKNAELKKLIRDKYHELIKQEVEATGMYNQYEDTDSEQGLSQDSTRQKIQYKAQLEKSMGIFTSLLACDKSKTIHEHVNLIDFGLNLLQKAEFKSFEDLFELPKNASDLEISKVISTFIFSLSSTESVDDFLKFLDSSYFPDINNKEKITTVLKEHVSIVKSKLSDTVEPDRKDNPPTKRPRHDCLPV